MNDVSGEDITRVEARIDELALSIERCRKLSVAAKTAIAAGAAWIVLTLLGIVPFVAFASIGALAFVIGGIVLLGSNATTWTQTEASLRASEALRRDMISRLELRTVDEGVKRLH